MVSLGECAVVTEGWQHGHLPLRTLGRAPQARIPRRCAGDNRHAHAHLLNPVDERGYACGSGRVRADHDDDGITASPSGAGRVAVAAWGVNDRAGESARARLKHGGEGIGGHGEAGFGGAGARGARLAACATRAP